jgi:hypothetical protein
VLTLPSGAKTSLGKIARADVSVPTAADGGAKHPTMGHGETLNRIGTRCGQDERRSPSQTRPTAFAGTPTARTVIREFAGVLARARAHYSAERPESASPEVATPIGQLAPVPPIPQ